MLLSISAFTNNSFAVTRHVGSGQPYTTLIQATAVVQSGDTILVHAGTYAGGLSMGNLQGTAALWITISNAPGEVVIFNGGGNAWQTSDAAYLRIKGFIFENQTANGFNMDDGGTFNTPSHHIIVDSCTFRNINATGNNDLLKMSGIDTFEVRNSIFMNGSPNGSGIDMVGCHDGLIMGCHFENQGSNSIQAKGGTRNVRIDRNFFKNGGQRTLNLGGSTGLAFFRPPNATYEAADLKVYSNVIIGSDAPIAYVGCVNTVVINNTIYLPEHWVIRILQETVDPSRFQPCGNNTFRNNIIYRNNQVTTDCNIGPDTDPQSFTFSNNLWFHAQNASWAGPSSLPVADANSSISQNPLFLNATTENFDLQSGSPAIGAGFAVSQPALDYAGANFNTPRSIGAFEGNSTTGIENQSHISDELLLYPNPSSGRFKLNLEDGLITIHNTLGETIFNSPVQQLTDRTVDLSSKPNGVYFISVLQKGNVYNSKIMVYR